MCLCNRPELFEKYKGGFVDGKREVWKEVEISVQTVISVYQLAKIPKGNFEAEGSPDWLGNQLRGGAIHCYQTLRDAEIHHYYPPNVYIIKCVAEEKDLLGVGDYDCAFSKIFVPPEEIDRILDEEKTRLATRA